MNKSMGNMMSWTDIVILTAILQKACNSPLQYSPLYRNIYLVFSSFYLYLDTIYAKCDNFVPMEGVAFEYQISTDDSKSWFDAVRTCKVRETKLWKPLTLISKWSLVIFIEMTTMAIHFSMDHECTAHNWIASLEWCYFRITSIETKNIGNTIHNLISSRKERWRQYFICVLYFSWNYMKSSLLKQFSHKFDLIKSNNFVNAGFRS